MRKILSVLAITAAVAFTANIALAGDGWSCDVKPPAKYTGISYGNSVWERCYIESAEIMCSPPRHMVGPRISCSEPSLKHNMELGYKLGARFMHSICSKENQKGYLPKNVTEAACEKDWKTYVT